MIGTTEATNTASVIGARSLLDRRDLAQQNGHTFRVSVSNLTVPSKGRDLAHGVVTKSHKKIHIFVTRSDSSEHHKLVIQKYQFDGRFPFFQLAASSLDASGHGTSWQATAVNISGDKQSATAGRKFRRSLSS